MNANQILNMIVRMLVRKGVGWGINQGGKMLTRGGSPPQGSAAQDEPAKEAPGPDARELARRARKAARLTRR